MRRTTRSRPASIRETTPAAIVVRRPRNPRSRRAPDATRGGNLHRRSRRRLVVRHRRRLLFVSGTSGGAGFKSLGRALGSEKGIILAEFIGECLDGTQGCQGEVSEYLALSGSVWPTRVRAAARAPRPAAAAADRLVKTRITFSRCCAKGYADCRTLTSGAGRAKTTRTACRSGNHRTGGTPSWRRTTSSVTTR